jgi:hypothetical protein
MQPSGLHACVVLEFVPLGDAEGERSANATGEFSDADKVAVGVSRTLIETWEAGSSRLL